MKGVYKEKCYESECLEEMKSDFPVSLLRSVPNCEDFTIC